MELAKQIELAPKNGDFVVLQDGWSGSWEVGRWAPERSRWVKSTVNLSKFFQRERAGTGGSTNIEFEPMTCCPLKEIKALS
jgi:hypothetical protein